MDASVTRWFARCQHGVQFLDECARCPNGGPLPINTESRHEATRACRMVHCYSCNVDEPVMSGKAYRTCPECFHVYYTPGELRAAYRAEHWRMWLRSKRSLFNRKDSLDAGLFWTLRVMVTARVRNITFCQHCVHDF